MATQNPQRFELGETLRNMRESAGLKPSVVERDLRWYAGKVSRVEQGTRVPVAAEIDRLSDLYKVTAEERETLHLLADAARKRESSARVADFAQTYVTLERGASEVNYYSADLINALVQTEGYARALLETSVAGQVEERLADRMRRGMILTGANPPVVRILLGEASLHQLVGGPLVLRAQLLHLLDVAKLPNVSIRILPFAVGAHRALGVGFVFLRLPAPNIVRVYIEGLTDATYIHEADETAEYERGFNQLWSRAADDAESATILRERINQLQ
ncbi:helix-turn-helix domain-containing protein [Amycolatopsis sp. NPDC059021]|uniref:helix-turn-helix domain-containing protein n=1 Tax=Amycolatopsis sp. NPDC059021 TaxID=3346704 RepID=UPI00366AF6B2